jgi:hypothetical protein
MVKESTLIGAVDKLIGFSKTCVEFILCRLFYLNRHVSDCFNLTAAFPFVETHAINSVILYDNHVHIVSVHLTACSVIQ